MKILQITAAAPHWYAHCTIKDGPSYYLGIAAWAIIERYDDDSTTQTVEALVQTPGWTELQTVEEALLNDEHTFTNYLYDPDL